MKPLKKTCLYSIGYVRQKGDWLNALRQFSGRTWVDLAEMEKCILSQLEDGSAYIDIDGNRVAKEDAAIIRLKTNVIVDADKIGGESRFVIINFRKNKYDMWEGIDFEYGDVASKEDVSNDEKATAKSDPLLEDVFFADREGWKGKLKELAVCEDWDNGRDKTGTGLLLPYLRYTYARLKEDGKIVQSKDGTRMAFNTGLVSRETLDPIIAVCKKNTRATPPWVFDDFCVWVDADKMDQQDIPVRQHFPDMPQNAEWFKNIEQTILRPELIDVSGVDAEFRVLFEKSIPLELLERMAKGRENEAVLLKRIAQLKDCGGDKTVPNEEDKMAYGDLLNKMGGKEDVIEIALVFLKRALAMAQKRLEWEVVTAVPMYAAYKSTENVTFSFMLPLSFDKKDPMRVDLVAVLDPNTDGNGKVCYRPQFLLKVNYAYSNARLLCRPSAEWLRDYRKSLV